MSDRLMSTGDVAEVLGVSEATVKRWADAGTLSCIRTPGGHRKFRLRDIAMHLASSRPSSAATIPTESQRDLDDIVSALLVGDVEKVIGAISAARLQRASMAVVGDTLLYPAYQQIIDACRQGRCEAFHQHIAHNTIVEAAARQRSSLRDPTSVRGRLISAPIPGERSDVLGRLAALVAVESGFDAYVLGAGLAASSVSRAAEDLGALWVVLSGNPGADSAGLVAYVEKILLGTERSRARVVCISESGGALDGLPEDVLVVHDLRQTESLLTPVALRMAR